MTQIKGVYGAVDDTLAAWRNDIEDIRAMIFEAFGRTQGVLRGFTMTPTVGSLAVDFTAGAAIVEQRGTDITGDGVGYFVYADAGFTVPFNAPSAGSRNDAVVFLWADRQYGALGVDADPPGGPQVVVVPGVSGSTTPRTDAQINTAVGPGGWFRFADVIIAPGNTSVQAGNITRHNVNANDRIGVSNVVRKTALQAMQSATLVNDNHMFFTGAPNAVYAIEVAFLFAAAGGGTSAMDAQLGLTLPSGSWNGGVQGPVPSITSGSQEAAGAWYAHTGAFGAALPVGVSNAGPTMSEMRAVASLGSTGGLVSVRWGQLTAAAFDLTLNSGSFLRYTRIA